MDRELLAREVLQATAEARSQLEPLHDLAWGASDPAATDHAAASLRVHLARLDGLFDSEILTNACDRIAVGEGNKAALMFEVFDPLLALCKAWAAQVLGKDEEAIAAAWYCVDGVLISLGAALAGFEFVEPWAHDKSETTSAYLARLSTVALAKGIPDWHYNALSEFATHCESMCQAPGDKNHARTKSALMSRLVMYLTDSAHAMLRLDPSAQSFHAWRTFPPQVLAAFQQ